MCSRFRNEQDEDEVHRGELAPRAPGHLPNEDQDAEIQGGAPADQLQERRSGREHILPID